MNEKERLELQEYASVRSDAYSEYCWYLCDCEYHTTWMSTSLRDIIEAEAMRQLENYRLHAKVCTKTETKKIENKILTWDHEKEEGK